MTFDWNILNWLQTLRTPVGDVLMPFISALGNKGLIWILLAAVLLLYPKTRKAGQAVAAALILDFILCNIIAKPLVSRTRPFDINTWIELLIAKPEDFSFPSGHTAAAFSVTAALFFQKNPLWLPSAALSVLMAFSRMYLYVHFPTDILGGMALGILCGWGGSRMVQRRDKKAAKEK